MNDEAANALLKTLEEPPSYVVLILLTDRPTQVLPTIASRCQAVRFDPPTTEQLAQRLQITGRPAGHRARPPRGSASATARRRIRLALGDGLQLRAGGGAVRARADQRHGRARSRGRRSSTAPSRRGQDAKDEVEQQLKEELQFLPKKEHKRRETRVHRAGADARTGARPRRRSTTRSSSPASGTATSPCVEADAPELVFHSDRLGTLKQDAGTAQPAARRRSSSTTRARA